MMHVWCLLWILLAPPLLSGTAAAAVAEMPAESARMLQAKDLIAEEQWAPAIRLLQAAADDRKEPNRDEALFWLAHSRNQAGELVESVESIRRLQREFEKSRWAAPAYSLLIELAQKLGRNDVLWWTAAPFPPAMPAPAVAPLPAPSRTPARRGFTPAPPVPPPPAVAPVPPAPAAPATPATPAVAGPPPPPPAWVADNYQPDLDLRVEALGRLMAVDAQRVIPMLRNIALEPENLAAARRAVFVLAQSRNPLAEQVVADVARRGPEPVQIVAIRELGRFGGVSAGAELLQVYYGSGTPRLKQQVVSSLAERADSAALFKIAQSERDAPLRARAILALGRAGGQEELRQLYARGPDGARGAVIAGLCSAGDDEGLIRIADREKAASLRKEVLDCLRLIGTPAAKAYLSAHPR
jgi:hypothetical protein